MKPVLTFWILTGLAAHAFSQATDTLALSYEQFRQLVLSNHPSNAIGDLFLQEGEAAMLEAKGGFDPTISGDLSQKEFKDASYYSIFNAHVDIPTKLGVKVNAGYDRTAGAFLNPENFDPDGGLFYAGVSVPLARGLLYDKRRAQLQMAEVIQESTIVERRKLLNELAYEAGLTYWHWWLAHEKLRIFEQARDNARLQFEGVREAALNGDRAPIDTVEARIQYQDLDQQVAKSRMDFAVAGLYLSTYLWNELGEPQLLRDGLIPEMPTPTSDLQLVALRGANIDTLVNDHPDMLSFDLDRRDLQIAQRLAREYMKPDIDVKYNFLIEAGNVETLSTNNYTWGVSMRVPLLFREEQARVQKTDIAISQTNLAQQFERAVLRNDIEASITKWQAYKEQYTIYEQVVGGYRAMLAGERELFDNGESSQFLINSRQARYIEAQLKLRELYAEIRSAEMESYFAVGILHSR